jgi:hypothetical protein
MKYRPALIVGFLLLIMLIPGCVGFSLVKKGERVSVGGDMSVEAPRDWNRFTSPKLDYWTLDGPNLQHVLFVPGVEDGKVPWQTAQDSEKAPQFRKNMTAIEVRELVQATMALEQYQKIQIADLKPARFAGHQGFTFHFTGTTSKGLDMRGRAVGTIVKGRLYMLLYRGARLYYFDRGLEDFEKIVTSTRIK